MKSKLILLSCVLSFTLIGCNKTPEQPPLSIADYSKQVVVMNGVIDKILNEKDPKVMFKMADSIESARAVNCIPVGEECNSYYKVINKVTNFTKEGTITNEQRMELFKMQADFQKDIRDGERKIREIWRDKLNAK